MENKVISKKLFKERMNTCYDCSSYDDTLVRCKECGCFLMLKAILVATKCPKDKWKKEEKENDL